MADADLRIMDGNGAFFRNHPRVPRINWSKIPFAWLEQPGVLESQRAAITDDFKRLVTRGSAHGFNAITLDDLSHVTDWAGYPEPVRQMIREFQALYDVLIAIAAESSMNVFITTDIMFNHPALEEHLGSGERRMREFLGDACCQLWTRFPAVQGVIVRIGESDGVDISATFRSRLVVRSPAQARRLLRGLLPLFERQRKLLVFRTWTVGAYRIGDLMWNRDTLRRVVRGISSPALVLSIKYGETDFFRFLALNKQFWRTSQRAIIELQARREYEGCGEFPSFTGWDYSAYRTELKRRRVNLAGIMVWGQTGGWTGFRRLTWIEDRAVWNDINSFVTVRMFRDGLSPEEALESWSDLHLGAGRAPLLVELMRLSDEVVKELLYIDDFARRKIFFRRLRLPPLLNVYWDRILITHPMRQILRSFVPDGAAKVVQGELALAKIDRMKELATQLGLPAADFDFQKATFELLAAARAYYFLPFRPEIRESLETLHAKYQQSYPHGYAVHIDFRPFHWRRRHLRPLFGLLLRERRGYRWVDRVFTLRILSWIYPLFTRRGWTLLPEFARNQAMGIDTVFK